ncbi:hypothetical protein RchiOBHm_Chr5g0044021 [Rosa chinensis]|uniref:Uncharacterized protein n=1 Tax=Rosa chinensis TaxID=74649 RepID=A0A2P6QDG5_ROSCH|nr:hypothetical protein RchiOBHm_Chr5g0044021 [Rosa chinensis]
MVIAVEMVMMTMSCSRVVISVGCRRLCYDNKGYVCKSLVLQRLQIATWAWLV